MGNGIASHFNAPIGVKLSIVFESFQTTK